MSSPTTKAIRNAGVYFNSHMEQLPPAKYAGLSPFSPGKSVRISSAIYTTHEPDIWFLRPMIRRRIMESYFSMPKVSRPTRRPVINEKVRRFLEKPRWSVRSLKPQAEDTTKLEEITSHKLKHLLRLSALPLPANEKEETEMTRTLSSQIHFVKAMQGIKTDGVAPLRALREEHTVAQEEKTVRLADLQHELGAEKHIGRNGKVRRVPGSESEEVKSKILEAEDWDPFKMSVAEKKNIGKYFFVRKEKGTNADGP